MKSFRLFITLFFVLASFTCIVSAFTNPSASNNFASTTSDWQSSSPTFDDYYRGSTDSYWPILNNLENDKCDSVASDFIVTIPIGGCSPSVVRSDLLAEQNVPVFCQLSAIRVNPLIDVSTIKSISFKGDYPKEVAGISFHPARAATSSSKTLLGKPIEENIGYVVIVLKKQSNEVNLTDIIRGNLTATIKYDSRSSFGTGAGEYYLEPVSDIEWARTADYSSFWGGKGYLRLKNVYSDSATIDVLTNQDDTYQTVTLKEGETSSPLYYPGQYCTSALKMKLNKIDNSEDMVKIDVDGNTFWVRKGSKLLNGKCTVTELNLIADEGGAEISISCSGNSVLDLELTRNEGNIVNKEYEKSSSIPKYMNLAEDSVIDLIDNFPIDKKEDGGYWGEDALYNQIKLSGDVGDIEMQNSLIDRFLEIYPESSHYESIRALKVRIGEYDYSYASRRLVINNDNYNIRLDGFRKGEENTNNVSVRIGGEDVKVLFDKKSYNENGEEISDDRFPRITVVDIDSLSSEFKYEWKEGKETIEKTFAIDVGDYSSIGRKRISVLDTSVREVAYISLSPVNLDSKTEANFTFNIDVEKRAFELTPEKARNKLDILNDSINEWEDKLETLGNIVKGTKAACLVTSGVLMLKNTISGFSGEGLAREKVMDLYENKCKIEGAISSSELHRCYSENSTEIEQAVKEYGASIDKVNDKVKCAKTSDTVSDGFLDSQVVDTSKYVDNLAKCTGISSSWGGYKLGNITVQKEDLVDASDYSAVLLKEEVCKSDSDTSDICKMATEAMEKALLDNIVDINIERLRNESKEKTGLELSFTNLNPDAQLVYYENVPKDILLSDGSYMKEGAKYSGVNYNGLNYVVTLVDNDVVKNVYSYDNGELKKVENVTVKNGISTSTKFIPSSSELCSNTMISPYVRYYESQNQQGFVAVVPLDINNGWYVHVDANDYSDAGVANAFHVCNVGKDGIIDNGVSGGDICAEFRISSGSDTYFTPCVKKTKTEITKLYSEAQKVIREANTNKNGITIDGEYIPKISPLSASSSEVECTDFMSVEDCNIMFNICDPVICPSSRCDFGGKFPVADVISTGIVGSMALCLPNFGSPKDGGVIVPICLSGVHAGLDSYISVLKSHRSCLEQNIETGEYIGICDEINAVYICELFWGQFSPILDTLLPKVVESMFGGVQTRGGAEYLTTQKSFDILDKSFDYFTSNYAEGAAKSFDLKNTESIGSSYCKNFVGGSVPTSSSLIDNLISPESPTQFYAHFSEDLFTEATVPSTSHYKVYYHIYAGNDAGAQYKIYLKSPPESSYYSNRQTLLVDNGYVGKGTAADESIDFTAPTGYKELCANINGREECGFGSVTSDFALDYVSQSYIADQADDKGITKAEDCVTTSASGWGMANLNVQNGVENSIGGRDIATTGITRICASTNPEQGIVGGNDVYCDTEDDESGYRCSPGYECKVIGGDVVSTVGVCENEKGIRQVGVKRWIDVGYCDSESVRCWIDSNSVEDNLGIYMAVNDIVSVNELSLESEELKELKENYGNVRIKLNEQREAIKNLKVDYIKLGDAELLKAIDDIIEALDEVAGVKDGYVGQGTNADRAEALDLKVSVYISIIKELLTMKHKDEEKENPLSEAEENHLGEDAAGVKVENGNEDEQIKESEEVLLEDVAKGDIIKDEEGIEYEVGMISTFGEGESRIIIRIQGVKLGNMIRIEGNKDSLLKEDGYEIVSSSSTIEGDKSIFHSGIWEALEKYVNVKAEKGVQISINKEEDSIEFKSKKEGGLAVGDAIFYLSEDDTQLLVDITGKKEEFPTGYLELLFINNEIEAIAEDLDWEVKNYYNSIFPFKGVWVDFEREINERRNDLSLDIRINRETMRIEFESPETTRRIMHDVEFYLNEAKDEVLADFPGRSNPKGYSLEEVSNILNVDKYVNGVAHRLNEILDGYNNK